MTSSPVPARPRANRRLAAVSAPPVAQAAEWLGRYAGAAGPLVNLSQAVPGYAPPDDLVREFLHVGAQPAAARYGPVMGDPTLRSAYADHVSERYGASILARDVGITAGCNQAFFAAMIALAGEGDAVILPTPWYFNHQMTLDMLGIEPRPLRTSAASGFVPTAADLEAAIDERVRALVLVTPNNPTGAIYTPERIAELYAVCRRHGIVLVLDETYRDFRPDPDSAPHALFADPSWRDDLISLYSFSKAYAVPGHRLGALIAGPTFMPEIEKVVDCIQICAPRPSQMAIAPMIEGTAGWRSEKAAEILARVDVFRTAMSAVPEWEIEQIGAYFAYLRHPYRGRGSAAVCEALATRLGLVTLPGTFFGPDGEDHVRIAFANVDSDAIRTFAARLAGVSETLLFPGESPSRRAG
ncbi:aminotransferase [Aureimonas pseudogalii]|uniref:Aminotransferase n=1 Tax=Aureimonas pseudogalii TaxID=1744844 RepID=A0A7W6EG15_9HYPH|nr:aminotransferase [Aureimonas pseudogalii]MBB3998040.1 aspartate/methionine/tyrosine aminotransferase [Aureimonas pseudogalii]